MTTSRQLLLLAGLLVVLAVIVVYQMQGTAPAVAPSASSNSTVGQQPGAASVSDVTEVRLDLISTGAEAFRAPRRDPFQFRANVPPPVANRPVAPPPVVTGPPPPPPPPDRPAISATLRLIGIYDIAGQRVAVLHDGTQNPPIHGTQGDVVEGRFRLLRVDATAVEMAYLDGGSPQRIPLAGQ